MYHLHEMPVLHDVILHASLKEPFMVFLYKRFITYKISTLYQSMISQYRFFHNGISVVSEMTQEMK